MEKICREVWAFYKLLTTLLLPLLLLLSVSLYILNSFVFVIYFYYIFFLILFPLRQFFSSNLFWYNKGFNSLIIPQNTQGVVISDNVISWDVCSLVILFLKSLFTLFSSWCMMAGKVLFPTFMNFLKIYPIIFILKLNIFLFDSFYLRMRLNEKDERYEAVLASLKLISNLMSFDDVCFLTFPYFLNSFIFILTNY